MCGRREVSQPQAGAFEIGRRNQTHRAGTRRPPCPLQVLSPGLAFSSDLPGSHREKGNRIGYAGVWVLAQRT